LFRALLRLRRLRLPDVQTSDQDQRGILNFLNFCGLPGLRSRLLEDWEKTWANVRQWTKDPYSALLLNIPHHLVLVFGGGEETSTGKFRHLLIGRPSGGQSPCGWVPWTERDRFPGEELWRDNIHEELRGDGLANLQMQEMVLVQINRNASSSSESGELEVEQEWYKMEWWLEEEVVFCDGCFCWKAPGDSNIRDLLRKRWLDGQGQGIPMDESST
jgi:hypothetical protein